MVVIDIFFVTELLQNAQKIIFFWNVINNLAEQHNKLHFFPF